MHSEQIYKAKRLEVEPRTELDLARTVHIAQARLSERAGLNARATPIGSRVSPVRMIERVQELALEDKLNALGNGEQFRDRKVIVPQVRPIKPDVARKRTRSSILAYPREEAAAVRGRSNLVRSSQDRRIKVPFERTGSRAT